MNSIIQVMGLEGRPRNPKLKAFHFCGSKRLLLKNEHIQLTKNTDILKPQVFTENTF